MMNENSVLISKYNYIKSIVSYCGYRDEIHWQANLTYDDLTESSFLRETAWVILSSGMKEAIIRNLFPKISESFNNWESANIILAKQDECYSNAITVFNHKQKINAIIEAAKKIVTIGFDKIKSMVSRNPIECLQQFSYIGPVTAYHLAKNVGLNIAKPDRHLVRIAKQEGYSDVQTFCQDISKYTGDCIPVVDIVFWRFATLENDYLNVISRI